MGCKTLTCVLTWPGNGTGWLPSSGSAMRDARRGPEPATGSKNLSPASTQGLCPMGLFLLGRTPPVKDKGGCK